MAPGKPSSKPKKPHKVPKRSNNYTFHGAAKVRVSSTQHMRHFKVIIQGIPRPMYRAAAKSHPQSKPGESPLHFYNPCIEDKLSLQACLRAAKALVPEFSFLPSPSHAFQMTIKFQFPRPKHHYSQLPPDFKLVLPTHPSPPVFVTKKPDTDNLTKLVLDSCNKIFFNDDSVVADLWSKKVFFSPDPVYYTDGQDKLGYTSIRITQIVAGTTAPGCTCEQCKYSSR